jgi:3-dehydrosphinganine reductase
MDMLQNLSTTTILLLSTAVLAILVSLAMGASTSKNHMPVAGRTILLTGATEGLGRAAALQLAAQGANLVLVSRNVGRLEETVAACRSAARDAPSQKFHYISADVSAPGFADAVLAETIAWNGGKSPDIVWCVAGVSTPLLWAHDDSLAASRHNMDVNYWGAAELSRAVLREWLAPENARGKDAEPKHLVFTASVLALFAVAGYAPYTPSKWALRALADTIAMEMQLYPDNPVEVHVVYPGTITSPGLERENRTKPEITVELEKDEPAQSPEDVARKAISGLQAGKYGVPVSFTGELMRLGVMGGSPRNGWVGDTVGSWFLPFVYAFVLWDMRGKISAWVRKHGQPRMSDKKV